MKAGKVVASTDEYTIYQRRDGRYAVLGADKNAINGNAKVAILLQHELITAVLPKEPEPEPEPEAEAEATAEAEAPQEEVVQEAAPEAAVEPADEPADEPAPEAPDDAAEEDKA